MPCGSTSSCRKTTVLSIGRWANSGTAKPTPNTMTATPKNTLIVSNPSPDKNLHKAYNSKNHVCACILTVIESAH